MSLVPDRARKLLAFLCHASGDKEAVRGLYYKLCKDGIDPWLDEEKLLSGQDWDQEIRKAVRNSDVVIVCLSKAAINNRDMFRKK